MEDGRAQGYSWVPRGDGSCPSPAEDIANLSRLCVCVTPGGLGMSSPLDGETVREIPWPLEANSWAVGTRWPAHPSSCLCRGQQRLGQAGSGDLWQQNWTEFSSAFLGTEVCCDCHQPVLFVFTESFRWPPRARARCPRARHAPEYGVPALFTEECVGTGGRRSLLTLGMVDSAVSLWEEGLRQALPLTRAAQLEVCGQGAGPVGDQEAPPEWGSP